MKLIVIWEQDTLTELQQTPSPEKMACLMKSIAFVVRVRTGSGCPAERNLVAKSCSSNSPMDKFGDGDYDPKPILSASRSSIRRDVSTTATVC